MSALSSAFSNRLPGIRYCSEPLELPDRPVGEWNTLRIRMIGEKVRVWLNDELVVDGVPMENFWGNSPRVLLPRATIRGRRIMYVSLHILDYSGGRWHNLR